MRADYLDAEADRIEREEEEDGLWIGMAIIYAAVMALLLAYCLT